MTRVYESDIIQLSVYRIILLHQYNVPVANYGYVRTVTETSTGERVRYIKTKLLSERQVVKLWRRYQSIRSGQVTPSCTCGGDFPQHHVECLVVLLGPIGPFPMERHMWFKNLSVYRFTRPFELTAEQLEIQLKTCAFTPAVAGTFQVRLG